MAHHRYHPSEMARVTPDSVRAALSEVGVRHGRVFAATKGAVRVEIHSLTRRGRQRAEIAILAALRPFWDSDYWQSYGVRRRYPWRPWCSWVTVTDPGRDWTDPETGLDYLALLEDRRAGDISP
jgi:hypothetical protein